ncbi:eEF1A lysine and N-terminal methyltransferase [Acropora cervicornis]|uniref:EEF1A lysine and N-terminal methyltransferase n=1 Tax=Acropora cervicornis TaxID=6130 RepID=A0AAD9QDN1_ACRCE|nr:eEF1A lysine and N-terminal methyltransferase [Acropora cervicornis]
MSLTYRSPVHANLKESYAELVTGNSPLQYGNYNDLCGVLHKYCKTRDTILIADRAWTKKRESFLIEDLYDAGYQYVVGVETTENNICNIREKNKDKRPEIKFVEGKLQELKVSFEQESFNVVIDRGALDALHENVSTGKRTDIDVTEYLKAVQRLLKVGGRFLCFTFATVEILNYLLDYFSSGWFFRVHLLTTQLSVCLPMFGFVLTKTRFSGTSTHSLQVIEVCLNGTENIQRLRSLSDVKTTLQEIQQYFVMKKSLERCCAGLHHKVDLHITSASPKQRSEPCYSMTVVDIKQSLAKNGKFAIFIVPQGRETEWMFFSPEGQTELANSAGFERVIITMLGRGHRFVDMDSIKKELSSKVMELAPKSLSSNAQFFEMKMAPLTLEFRNGNSELSGDFVVEDVDGDGGHQYRRLIFLSNRNVVQSEARLVADKTGPKKKKGKSSPQASDHCIDHGYLACQHHRVIITGLAWIEGILTPGEEKRSLIVGLGGGGLAMFLHQYFKQLSIEVVELDPSISDIANSWFQLKEDERMKVIIQDESSATYDVVIFDVDSKDTSVFILNLVCRNTDLRNQVVDDLRAVFPELYSIKIEEEVNEIVFALPHLRFQTALEDRKFQESPYTVFQTKVKDLQQIAKGQGNSWDSSLDLCELAQNLRIV